MKILGLNGSERKLGNTEILITKYRAPRTVYSTWGTDERAKEIFQEVADQWDGWF